MKVKIHHRGTETPRHGEKLIRVYELADIRLLGTDKVSLAIMLRKMEATERNILDFLLRPQRICKIAIKGGAQ